MPRSLEVFSHGAKETGLEHFSLLGLSWAACWGAIVAFVKALCVLDLQKLPLHEIYSNQ